MTKELAKSSRTLCKMLYQEPHDYDILKEFREDKDIAQFSDDFLRLLDNSIKRVKQTKEEQSSEQELKIHLTKKIYELESQIREKEVKKDKLVKEHNDFKNNFLNNNREIDVRKLNCTSS